MRFLRRKKRDLLEDAIKRAGRLELEPDYVESLWGGLVVGAIIGWSAAAIGFGYQWIFGIVAGVVVFLFGRRYNQKYEAKRRLAQREFEDRQKETTDE